MSIVQLEKVTLIGHTADKAQHIENLQSLGCLHIIPLHEPEGVVDLADAPKATGIEALRFLASSPTQRRQVLDATRFDADAVRNEALRIRDALSDLEHDRDDTAQRLEALAPWGEFEFAPIEQSAQHRLWFYAVPSHQMAELAEREEAWGIINKDHRFTYITVVSIEEPQDFPIPRTLCGATGTIGLRAHLESVEEAIEDLQAEWASLTRWTTLLAHQIDELMDSEERTRVSGSVLETHQLFALQAWLPVEQKAGLNQLLAGEDVIIEYSEPQDDELPPTLFDNPSRLRAGEDLVTFYRTPNYRLWDPSSSIFVSFAMFFAMILADAGYGLILAGISAFLWPKLKTTEKGRAWQVLLTALSASSVVYGVLIGSYFGVAPDPSGFLAQLQILDLNNPDQIMPIVVVIGALHLIYACLRDAYRLGLPGGLAPTGWSLVIVGGLLWGAASMGVNLAVEFGQALLVGGLLLVIAFTDPNAPSLKRLLAGLMALTRLTKLFGDVLSYLRLFALGLASASLAITFNTMAADIQESIPGTGFLLSLLVLLLGHGINFLLGIVSAVIHGMRLNLLEFMDWGVQEEGDTFKSFKRTEHK